MKKALADRSGKARTGELVRVMNEVRKRGPGKVRLAWVKARCVGIPGGERADERAKFYTRVVGLEGLTKGGISNTS